METAREYSPAERLAAGLAAAVAAAALLICLDVATGGLLSAAAGRYAGRHD